MRPFTTMQFRAACFCLIGIFLIGPSASAADYNSGVSAKVLKKTSVTGNGQKITYPNTDRAEVTEACWVTPAALPGKALLGSIPALSCRPPLDREPWARLSFWF